MHIAICDDKIADRKHLERLLQRISDRRKDTKGILYIDSYGHLDALMKAPMMYDLFFVDMTQLPPHGMETAILLRSAGVTAPIVLCSSTIHYRDCGNPPTEIIHLDKPYKENELTEIIDLISQKKENATPTIEIRNDMTTYYIYEDDFIYAYPEGYCMKIVLKDGRVIMQIGSLSDLIPLLTPFDSFLLLGKKYVVNSNHIQRIDGKYVILSDRTRLPLGFGDKKRIWQLRSDLANK